MMNTDNNYALLCLLLLAVLASAVGTTSAADPLSGQPSVPRNDSQPTCEGMDSDAGPCRNLDLYSHLSDSKFMHMLTGEWLVLSSINWFMETWCGFHGNFTYNTTSRTLVAHWSFRPYPLPTTQFEDHITFNRNASGREWLTLDPYSMPSWLTKFFGRYRTVRIVDIARPSSSGRPLRYVVLFDCGISIVPGGELFVLAREMLSQDELDDIQSVVRSNGISKFFTLPASC
eukprot:TRINITY_DN11943_c0_g1_i1.p1 TRINITY_DN11943_c0_g1~~TRINITY_DN11943_c0_g1_i1.p1  ORF type:complete len:230 (-),score=35.61 TRINITY_DN11943_c0_g1_i1:44-733(-)